MCKPQLGATPGSYQATPAGPARPAGGSSTAAKNGAAKTASPKNPVQPVRTGGLFGRGKAAPEPQVPAADTKALAPKPGDWTDWIDVGGLLDTLSDGQWHLTAVGNSVKYDLVFCVRDAAGGEIAPIRRFDNLEGNVTLAYDGDTRYTRRIRLADEALYELVDYLKKRPVQGKPPSRTLIYGSTFSAKPGDAKYTAALNDFVKLMGATALSRDPQGDDGGNGAFVRVIVADTQAIFRAGLRKVFALEDDIRVVGQAETLAQTQSAVKKFSSDVVIFEAALAQNPVEAVADLLRQNPQVRIVVVTPASDEEMTLDLFRRGAHGIVSREVEPELLVDCLRKVAGGETWLDPQGTRWVMEAYRNQNTRPGGARPKVQLTPKETLIVSCVTQGMKNKEIALRVGTTEQVVKNYLRKVFGAKTLSVRARPKIKDSAEVYVGEDFIGLLEV